VKGARKKTEGKAKQMSAENANILESLPEPPEFEGYESLVMAHLASLILPSEFTSEPEPLALFNLVF